jgi:hypothetical protein
MQNITKPGKYTGTLTTCEVYGEPPKYYVLLQFECPDETGALWHTEGKFYVSLKDGGENVNATAQLRNAGWNPKGLPLWKNGEFDVNTFWDTIDEFQKVLGKEHKFTVKESTFKDVVSYKVEYIDGPHRGTGGGMPKKASRPTASNEVPF